jgi:uncharacterized BrkB/YihY/UPF0761 family membrane protein
LTGEYPVPPGISREGELHKFGLLVLTWLILFFLIFLFCYIPTVGLKNIHASLPLVLSLAVGFLVFLMIFGSLLLVVTMWLGKDTFSD